MKKSYLLGLFTVVLGMNFITAQNAELGYTQKIQDALNLYEQKGGKLTQQELEKAKKQAREIIRPEQLQQLISTSSEKIKSKKTLESNQEILDLLDRDDIQIMIECINYIHTGFSILANEWSTSLRDIANSPEYQTQLYHFLAYSAMLEIEIEKLVKTMNCDFNIETLKERGDKVKDAADKIAPVVDVLALYEQRGGKLTKEELDITKKKAEQIVCPRQVRQLVRLAMAVVLEKLLVTCVKITNDKESAGKQLIEVIVPEDLELIADIIDYCHNFVGVSADEIANSLQKAATAPDCNAQLYHSMTYLIVLGQEVAKLIEKIQPNISLNK